MYKASIITIYLILAISNVFAQSGEAIDPDNAQPEFVGGNYAMYKFLGENTVYPEEVRKAGIQGKVLVSFVVNKDGSINQDSVKVFKGLHPRLDLEAVEVVKKMPKWKPGTQNGDLVIVRMLVSVYFRLDSPNINISGKLLSKESSEPVQRANLIALPSGARAFSTNDGSFKFTLPNKDSIITIQHLGYKCVAIPVSNIKDSIYLEPRTVLLPKVNVYNYENGIQFGGSGTLDSEQFGFHARYQPDLRLFIQDFAVAIANDSSYTQETPKTWAYFTISKQGIVENVEILPTGSLLEQVIKDFLKSTDNSWTPASYAGVTFDERFRLPITFDATFTEVNEPASFDGGVEGFLQYVNTNLKYPTDALHQKKQGQIFVQFDVEKDGSIEEVQVVKGLSCTCDEEAIRLVETGNSKRCQNSSEGYSKDLFRLN